MTRQQAEVAVLLGVKVKPGQLCEGETKLSVRGLKTHSSLDNKELKNKPCCDTDAAPATEPGVGDHTEAVFG